MIDFFIRTGRSSWPQNASLQIDFSPGDHHEIPPAALAALSFLSGFLLYHYPGTEPNPWISAFYFFAAAASTYLWLHFWRLYHYIADTPTSRVASASQGLVELRGTGELPAGAAHRGLPMGPACLWQSYTIHKGDRRIDAGHSKQPFVLRDDGDTCVIYPQGATVISSSNAYPRSGGKKASIRYLRPGCHLYVLGQLRTVGGDNNHYDPQEESTQLLRQWKNDQPKLLNDYDSNEDGRIDTDEWELARAEARRQAQNTIAQKRRGRAIHEIRKPDNALPLVISDKEPKSLERRYYWLGNTSACLALFCFVWAAIKF